MTSVVSYVSPSDYLRAILEREAVDTSVNAPLRGLEAEVQALCEGWAGRYLLEVYPAGSFEKGTANRSGTNIDFIVSLSPQTPFVIKQIYESLLSHLQRAGLEPERRTVSIGLTLEGATIDVVPAKRESLSNDIHEIYSARRMAAIKTNLNHHVLDVIESGRREEIRVLKLWRDQHALDFPSFYLELSTMAALRRRPLGELADNVWAALGYFEQLFVGRAILD
ncbi:MAG: nucleotidyltransferase, partial [Hyphomicrobiales bacterium]